jgi:hypothetical protein
MINQLSYIELPVSNINKLFIDTRQVVYWQSIKAAGEYGVRWQAQRDTALDEFLDHAIQSTVDASRCRRIPNLSPAPRASNIFNDGSWGSAALHPRLYADTRFAG